MFSFSKTSSQGKKHLEDLATNTEYTVTLLAFTEGTRAEGRGLNDDNVSELQRGMPGYSKSASGRYVSTIN